MIKTNMNKAAVIVIFAAAFLLSINIYSKDILAIEAHKKICWISYLDMQDLLMDLSEEDFRQKVGEMYDNICDQGINCVIVHARAMGDAMYESNYFSFTSYLDSDMECPDYDTFGIMVDMAHDRGLSIEAWINPYRLSRNDETTMNYKSTPYYEEYKDYTIEYIDSSGQTCLALDPSRDETNELIINQVDEILQKYDVDGIHFDDYFYVPDMDNETSVETKMDNVNVMLRKVYLTIKEKSPNCQFGISPMGNIDNAREQGADIDTWLSTTGYVDYIIPQLYWSDAYISNGVSTAMFYDRAVSWSNLNTLGIPIYAGLALYKAGEISDIDTGWGTSDNNLINQYEESITLGYDGYALFRYMWLEENISVMELDNLHNGTIAIEVSALISSNCITAPGAILDIIK